MGALRLQHGFVFKLKSGFISYPSRSKCVSLRFPQMRCQCHNWWKVSKREGLARRALALQTVVVPGGSVACWENSAQCSVCVPGRPRRPPLLAACVLGQRRPCRGTWKGSSQEGWAKSRICQGLVLFQGTVAGAVQAATALDGVPPGIADKGPGWPVARRAGRRQPAPPWEGCRLEQDPGGDRRSSDQQG